MQQAFRSSVIEYLESLPEPVVSRLYQVPATCLAVFRLLPELGQYLVLSILFLNQPFKMADLPIKSTAKSRVALDLVRRRLRALSIIREHGGFAQIHKSFRRNFRIALTGGDTSRSFGVPSNSLDKSPVDSQFLAAHAKRHWESILHYMVGTDLSDVPNDGVLMLLRHAGLMEGKNLHSMSITQAGFQFLLQDVHTQLWALLLQYLSISQQLQMDPVDILHFIFMLGSMQLGQGYSLTDLSPTQTNMLEDLCDYGIVYKRSKSSRRFYPTPLAIMLTTDAGTLVSPSAAVDAANTAPDQKTELTSISDAAPAHFVLLETNYRVYAYTSSPLQIAILNLFVHLKSRFPNLVSGVITRDSVRSALAHGITAEQIILYLTVHAHPQMLRNDPVLPGTIADQIKLWQLEKERMTTTQGYLFKDFSGPREYEIAARYATEIGVLTWQNPKLRVFFVNEAGNSQVVDFINRRLKK
ncbi:hypothetical protein CANCADRAFT_20913 [Tortispora caseinolytica NRRL Y-17796]|uniref:RNA polymerase II transcription factor B subunit 2 n=1 Tax=Tortispora caseinolytica NRRL Y-17796 TaxID=767744 RepID=A0A1E4TIX0_9ASCO|nr:hypothetical protein CANCADRAFT_20913 [Tortispora caseinolytica NRRL Y-17796]